MRVVNGKHKLDYQRLGPFVNSDQIKDVAFRLDHPQHMHLRPVFHLSLLELYLCTSIPDWGIQLSYSLRKTILLEMPIIRSPLKALMG